MFSLGVIGALLAFAAALPVTGPATVLVADAALRGARARAWGIGLGAAVPEAVWAALAFLGAGVVFDGAPAARTLAETLAGLVLAVVAVALWRSRPHHATPHTRTGTAFLLGFSTTALNPTLLFTWGTVSTALLATGQAEATPAGALALSMGVLIGSASAMGVLVAVFGRVGARFGDRARTWFARGASVLLLGLAVVAFARAATGS